VHFGLHQNIVKNNLNYMIRPLSKKSRYLSLGVLFLFFVILGPAIILYSEGYRFDDLDEFFFIKTGGIYIHSSEISNVRVYIDDEFHKSSGLILRNTLIQNLRPKEDYVIRVEKDDYHSYVKTLPVFPSLVTEAVSFMIPIEIKKREILEFFDQEGNQIDKSPIDSKTKKPTFKINPEYNQLMIDFELRLSPEQELLEAKEKANSVATSTNTTSTSTTTKDAVVPIKKVPEHFISLGIEDSDLLENLIQKGDLIAWLDNGNIITHWIGKIENIPHYFCFDRSDCKTSIELNWNGDIKQFDYLPGRNDVWAVSSSNGIWAVEVDDRSERNIQPIYLGKDLTFKIGSNNRIVVRDENKFIELSF
jgi:hypothetical protein